jgi:hypothetical protein
MLRMFKDSRLVAPVSLIAWSCLFALALAGCADRSAEQADHQQSAAQHPQQADLEGERQQAAERLAEGPGKVLPGQAQADQAKPLQPRALAHNLEDVEALSGSPAGSLGTESDSLLAGPRPKAFVREPDHDFGTIIQGSKVKHVFKVQNIGDAPLKLIKAKGS